jgi:hypothetical protein
MSRPVRTRPHDGFAPAHDRHTADVGAASLPPPALAARAHREQPDVAPSDGLPGSPVDMEVRVLDAARPDPRAPPTWPPRWPGDRECRCRRHPE